jgi:flagellar hook-basal body complex protein FliE
MSIDRIGSSPRLEPIRDFDPRQRQAELEGGGGATSFGAALGQALDEVNQLQFRSEEKVEAFVRGEDVPLHEVVLSQEEAEISFRLMLEVRDQLFRAYQDLLRTQM